MAGVLSCRRGIRALCAFADLLRAAFAIPDGASAIEIGRSLSAGLSDADETLKAALPYLLNILGATQLQIGAIQASELVGVRTREAGYRPV